MRGLLAAPVDPAAQESTRGRRRRRTPVSIFAIALTTISFGLAASAPAADEPPKADLGGTICAGNSIYVVCVDDIGNIGRYTARTGAAHPVPGRNVLFAGESSAPGTSFNSYRSFTSGLTYTQGSVPGGTNLNAFAPLTEPIGGTGVRTTWQVTGADDLRIVQVVNVNGTTLSDSNIEVTTTITNTGTGATGLGIRYLWDYQIGQDDGPTFRERFPDGPARIHEAEFRPAPFLYYEIEDNEFPDPTSPLYTVLGTGTGPTTVTPPPTNPTQITYGCWPEAFSTAFDYAIVPGRDVATVASPCGAARGGDNTTIYWWGRDAQSARTLGPNDQADTDFDGIGDACDPRFTSTPCKVTGGGFITTAKHNFGFNAQFSASAGASGHVNYQDKAAGHLKGTEITGVACRDTQATIIGTGTWNRNPASFTVHAEDNGEPGRTDRFRIVISNGYSAVDALTEGGNIQIHRR